MGQCCSADVSPNVNLSEARHVQDLSLQTGLDLSELKRYYTEFIKDYPSGHLTKKQFHSVYEKFFPEDIKGNQTVERVFKTFDQNNDGTIDFREFMIALSVLSKGTLEQKLSLAFYLYDENGDGVLTFNEILDIVKIMYCMSESPNVTDDLPSPEVFATELFAELDTDQNGIITLEEFTAVGCQDPTIANLLLANVEENHI